MRSTTFRFSLTFGVGILFLLVTGAAWGNTPTTRPSPRRTPAPIAKDASSVKKAPTARTAPTTRKATPRKKPAVIQTSWGKRTQKPIPIPPHGYKQPVAKQLTFKGVNGEAYFSPDGSKLIFQSYKRKAHRQTQIYILDLKTGKEKRVTHHDGDDTCSYFHPNGKGILYAATDHEVKENHRFRRFAPSWLAKHLAKRMAAAKKQGWKKKKRKKHRRKYKWAYKPYEIYTADLNGKNRRRLTHATGYDAEGTYSPNGKLVIFSSRRDGDQELYLMNADGRGQRRLTWRKGNDGGAFVSPSNKQVTWRSFDRRGNAQVMVSDLVNGQLKNVRQLTWGKGIHWAPFWHPSGKWILFSSNHDDRWNFELYLINTEGTCLKRLTYSKAQDVLPVFSPDGKTIVFTSRKGRYSQVYSMPFVMPKGCTNPAKGKNPAFQLHFRGKPKKRAHGAHSYRRYRRYRHYKKKGKHSYHSKKGHKGHRYHRYRRYKGHYGKKAKAKKQLTRRASQSRRARLERDLYMLSHPLMEGRDAGTNGIKLAARYIAGEFAKAKLKAAGDKGSFFQKFQVTTGIKLSVGNKLSFERGGKAGQKFVRHWALKQSWIPFGFSSTGAHKVGVVFAGYGISDDKSGYDDYAGLNVKGKIVLLLRKTPRWKAKKTPFGSRRSLFAEFRYKVLNARTRGAVGVLIVDPPQKGKDGKIIPAKLVKLRPTRGLTDAGVLAAHIQQHVAQVLLGKQSLAALVKQIDLTLEPASKVLDGALSFRVNLRRTKAEVSNVIAVIPGSHPTRKKEFVVVGAHYDHLGYGHHGAFPGNQGKIHHGADDNASGTAALLDLARALQKKPAERSVVLIAFAAEERGLLGSAHYVRNSTVPFNKIVTMINLDMIGRLRKNKLMVQGSGTAQIFEPLLKLTNGRARFHLKMRKSGYGPSDHTSFYSRKVPVLFFFTGAHREYHRPEDTFSRLNIAGVARISRFVEVMARRIAALDAKPVYQKTARPKRARKVRGGMRAYLGTIPDYGSGVKNGVKLSGVRGGAPADKAGVKGGDILIQIGKFPLRDLYDMVIALKHYSAGDKVKLVVLRKGKKITLNALLKSRSSSRH